MYDEGERVGNFLLDAGLISRTQLEASLGVAYDTQTPLAQVLIEGGILNEDEIRRAVARGLGVPFVRLSANEIAHDALTKIPEPFCRAHGLVAFSFEGSTLEVALLDIADLEKLTGLQLHAKYNLVPRLTDRESMTRALLQYQKHLKDQFGSRIAGAAGAIVAFSGTSTKDLEAASERAPVVALVDALIGHALYQSASAIHLETRESGLLLRYRVGTMLYDAMVLPVRVAPSVGLRLKALAGLRLDSRAPQEGRFRVALGEGSEDQVSIRVSTMPVGETDTEKIVLHLLHEHVGRRGFTLESLGLHGAGLEQVHQVLAQKSGLLLVCGPAHSGKTTFLYTLLDMFGGSGQSVASIEEKVELRLPFVTQTQVAEDVGLSLAAGLRALLRQDPDVVMVSNIRDRETALLAVEAANRGRLVLAAIEADTAANGVSVLLELGVSPLMLAASLQISVGLRLVRKLCPNKRETHRLVRIETNTLEPYVDFGRVLAALKAENALQASVLWKDVAFFRAEACSECRGGYQGYVGLQEVLPASATSRELISREVDADSLESQARDEGMLNVVEDALYKAAQGLTSIEEVLKVAGER